MERFLTQKEAAALVRKSVRFLRDSNCPKIVKPGNGRGPSKRNTITYDREAVVAWMLKDQQ